MPTTILFTSPPPSGSSIQVFFGSKTSRFTRVFRVNYPMVPLPPSAVVPSLNAAGDITQPIVTVSLPTNFDRDIYGVQIDRGPLFLGAPQVVTFVSDQVGDTRKVSVYGFDAFDNVLVEEVLLNGTTPVSTTTVFTSLGWVNVED